MTAKKAISKKAGKNIFHHYWLLTKKKVILGFILMVVVKIYLVAKYGWLVAMDRSGGYDWILGIIIYIAFGVALSKKINLPYKKVATIGAVGGLYLGALVAVLDLVLFRNAWAMMNLIRKPILFLVIGMAVTTIVYLLVAKDENNNIKKNKH